MPAYDYRCAECGEIFELTARMGQAPSDPACPKDDGGTGARVFGSGVAIHTGASGGSFGGDFDFGGMPDMGGMPEMGGMPDMGGMGGMGGHGHDHGHDDFGFDDF